MPQKLRWIYDLSEVLPDDIRVTTSATPKEARSESWVAIDPSDPRRVVAASKKFSDPATYRFTIATYWSADGGNTWTESAPLAVDAGWAGSTDPILAWDDQGHAYLVALPFRPGTTPTNALGPIVGIAVYRSVDGGRTWSAPLLIHTGPTDDKQWAVGDYGSASPYKGNVYAVWDDGALLRFARTTDRGATWKGTGNSAAGTMLANDSFAPDLVVAPDGAVYAIWLAGGTVVKFVKSTDGGATFSPPAVAVSGITNLASVYAGPAGWPQFPGSTFRVLTLVGAIATRDGTLIVTWADAREGPSRVYYRRSKDGGATWEGPPSGQPLIRPGLASASTEYEFHPQPAASPAGGVAVAFYVLGPGGNPPRQLIDVDVAASDTDGESFNHRITVTDQPWDPAIEAPLARGNPLVTFIGEYFGFDADPNGYFIPVWTDTRTGGQELFTTRTLFAGHWDHGHKVAPWNLHGQSRVDGPGIILLPGGGIIHIPTRGPKREIVDALATHEAARRMKGRRGQKIRTDAAAAMGTAVKRLVRRQKARQKARRPSRRPR